MAELTTNQLNAIVHAIDRITSTVTNNSLFTSGNAYNVKSYGLVGDGTTDNSAAFSTLLNTIAPNGATIFFPAGTYNFGSNTSVTDKHFNVIGMFATIHATF